MTEKADSIHRDPSNLNRGTPRGTDLLAKAVASVGYGRSGVITEDNVIVAGNHLHKIAQERGDEIQIIEVDSSKPTFLKIKGLRSDDPRAFKMAVFDNRVGQLNLNMDLPATEAAIQEIGLSPEDVGYTIEELRIEEQSAEPSSQSSTAGVGAGISTEGLGQGFGVFVKCHDEADQKRFYERMRKEKRECRLSNM